MKEIGAVVTESFQVVALENVQGDEFGWPLAGRRIFVDLVSAIGG
jgi:hypothetical protein